MLRINRILLCTFSFLGFNQRKSIFLFLVLIPIMILGNLIFSNISSIMLGERNYINAGLKEHFLTIIYYLGYSILYAFLYTFIKKILNNREYFFNYFILHCSILVFGSVFLFYFHSYSKVSYTELEQFWNMLVIFSSSLIGAIFLSLIEYFYNKYYHIMSLLNVFFGSMFLFIILLIMIYFAFHYKKTLHFQVHIDKWDHIDLTSENYWREFGDKTDDIGTLLPYSLVSYQVEPEWRLSGAYEVNQEIKFPDVNAIDILNVSKFIHQKGDLDFEMGNEVTLYEKNKNILIRGLVNDLRIYPVDNIKNGNFMSLETGQGLSINRPDYGQFYNKIFPPEEKEYKDLIVSSDKNILFSSLSKAWVIDIALPELSDTSSNKLILKYGDQNLPCPNYQENRCVYFLKRSSIDKGYDAIPIEFSTKSVILSTKAVSLENIGRMPYRLSSFNSRGIEGKLYINDKIFPIQYDDFITISGGQFFVRDMAGSGIKVFGKANFLSMNNILFNQTLWDIISLDLLFNMFSTLIGVCFGFFLNKKFS